MLIGSAESPDTGGMNDANGFRLWLTPQQVAWASGFSLSRVRKALANGSLESVKVGHRRRINASNMWSWLHEIGWKGSPI
jgi:excisionase family DNA binding protein